jgi:peptide/nickel transport system substrate-binding protein
MKFKKLISALLVSAMLVSAGASVVTAYAAESTEEIVLGDYRNIAPGVDDAYYCSVILYVWEPLITMDENGEPVGKLAESWEMSEDAKTWTFHLQEGVKFHDGEDFNADAVLYNFDRMRYEVKSSAFYSLNIDSFYPNLDEVKKIDDYTVELTFTEPAPSLLYTMTNFGSAMFSPSCFDEEYNFTGIAQGTGPFKITENVKDEYVLLERNEEYWGEKAKASSIRVKTIPDVDTRYSALKSGEIMGVIDLKAITPALATELEKDENFAITTTNSTMIDFLCLNGTAAPFDDVRMRQAVSMAIDRDAIANTIYLGYASPTSNILNYSTPFYTEQPVTYDLEQAKALAAEVLGDERVSVKYLIQEGSTEQKTEAELISAILSELGIDVTIETYDWATMKEMMAAGDYGIARAQQGLSNMEALTIFKRFMDSEGDQNINYSLGVNNEEVDSLIDQADSELDMEKRQEIYTELQELSVEIQPVVPLFNERTLMVYNTELDGYEAQIYGIDLPNVCWAE